MTPIEQVFPVSARIGKAKYETEVIAGKHRLLSDELPEVGGGDTGPSPYDFLLAALGSCTAITLRMYADRKQWPLDAVEVKLRHSRIHAEDCADCETKQGRVDVIERVIELVGALDAEQCQRLLQIAEHCPVHRTLTSEIKVRTRLVAAAVSTGSTP